MTRWADGTDGEGADGDLATMIRRRRFRTVPVGGYDPDEVEAFLDEIASRAPAERARSGPGRGAPWERVQVGPGYRCCRNVACLSSPDMGEQLRLRPAGEDDLAVIERLTSDPEATGEHSWYGWSDPWRFRNRWRENGLLADDRGMLMVLRGDERLGFVSWIRQQTSMSSYCWSIGVGMRPEVRGLGYGTEAQRLLVRYLFAHTQVNRVQALTEATNTAEQWALQKAGFTREGVLRGYGFRDGAWRDAVIYSVLRHEVTEHEHDASGSVTEKPKASTTRVPRRGARDRTA